MVADVPFPALIWRKRRKREGLEGVKRSTMENPQGVVYIAPQNPIFGLKSRTHAVGKAGQPRSQLDIANA
jgi:hypothetical protein